ncbi:MAG TPA: hypothetical protein DD640_10460 [Clostridiales bacterium]|nr:hypothetical protein [Clostridiales bacterium]
MFEDEEHSSVVPSILVRPEKSKKAAMDECSQVVVKLLQAKLGGIRQATIKVMVLIAEKPKLAISR